MSSATSVWMKVRQLTGSSKDQSNCQYTMMSAEVLNDHYATISTDVNYAAPAVKCTCNNKDVLHPISEWRLFNILDSLQPTYTGLDNIPAWFLRIGAPFSAAPLAEIMNLSLSSSVVPEQWKSVSILPVSKVAAPQQPSDYRPISNTSVISRILDYIYPSLRTPPSSLDFTDQFAFQPTASTTTALIYLLQDA